MCSFSIRAHMTRLIAFVSDNAIHLDGVRALAHALKENNTLKELILACSHDMLAHLSLINTTTLQIIQFIRVAQLHFVT